MGVLKKADKQLCKDLESLQLDARFIRVGTWLQVSADELYDDVLTLEGPALYRALGCIQVIKDFFGCVEASGEALDRYARVEMGETAPEGDTELP